MVEKGDSKIAYELQALEGNPIQTGASQKALGETSVRQ